MNSFSGVVIFIYIQNQSDLITLAGTPATTELSGTPLLTTSPAPTTEFLPTVTPGKIIAPAPIQAFRLIRIGFTIRSFRLAGSSKRETGKSAQEHIRLKLIEVAKEKIFDRTKSISEIAYELGSRYPQHFTRMFKKNTGYSPNEYRSLN